MLTIGTAYYSLKANLENLYDDREAAAIAHELLHHVTGLSKTERLMKKDNLLTETMSETYKKRADLLMKGTPLQYVTGAAWFMGAEYIVNQEVLIPRPETEELIQWIIADAVKTDRHLNILDIGTGSGCIPISLKTHLPKSTVTACDVSDGALAVAKSNASKLNADITFLQLDFLDVAMRSSLGIYDTIVSNPPYIPRSEASNMHINVSKHEPDIALFVPDDDALVFYRAIADFGLKHLSPSGNIYCELDTDHAMATKQLFEHMGYESVALRKDIHDNYRMIKASLPIS